ncbi:integral membrane protein [Apiospora rasikravindrae]|uniref:Integral membrane protein n=1 Tax=Apiospora rasikravindrae TaxID=990691 RepID=A0ABR1SY57_9PEZI
MGYTFQDAVSDPSEGRIIILSLVTIPLCVIATILRLFAPKRPGTHGFRWDDFFAVLALVGFLVYAISPFIGMAVAGDMSDEELAILSGKLAYICTPFFYINQLFARGSLFVLYYRIFWTDRAFVKWVYTLACIHVCWFITFFFMVLFLCNPISLWWDISGTQPGYCLDGNTFLVAEETINSSLDFATIALTVAVVHKLQTKSYIKTKLSLIFLIGGLSGVIGFVKIGIVYSTENTNGQENDTNAFWDILQMATSIFCACAPMVKTMLPLAGLWVRLRSSIASHSSRSRSKDRLSGSELPSHNNDGLAFGLKRPRFWGGPRARYTPELDVQPLQGLPKGHRR